MLRSVRAVRTTLEKMKMAYCASRYDAKMSAFDSPSSGAKICEREWEPG